MRVRLCVLLAAVHAVRIRRISHNNVWNSEAEVAHSRRLLGSALTLSEVASNHGTSLLQPKPPKEQAKAATEVEFEAAAEDFFDGVTQPPRVRTVESAAETEFEQLLAAAITEMMAEEIAVAKAAHDQVFHRSYYRAVKAETAAKAAAETARIALTKASHQALVCGRDVVFTRLLEHTALLDTGATLNQLLEHIEKQLKTYSQQVKEYLAQLIKKQFMEGSNKRPEVVGLGAFLAQVRATEDQLRARKGQEFDSEAMTKLLLALARVMVKAMHFEHKAKLEGPTRNPCSEDIPRELSEKMKSEIGLDMFLQSIRLTDKQLNKWQEQTKEEEYVTARLNA